jgi:peptide/nickel transport system permease protein
MTALTPPTVLTDVSVAATQATAPAVHSPAKRSHVRYVLQENPVTLIAAALFVGFVLLALFGPWLVPFDPLASNSSAALQAPGTTHWFGTDALGRDIFSRVVVATRLDLGIAFSAVFISFVIGMPLGLAAGFFGGWWDRIVSRAADTIMAFPLFVLAMGIVAALGNTVGNIILATAVINLPFYVRVARAEANVRRNAGWVEAHLGHAFVPQRFATGHGAGQPEHGLGDLECGGP